MNTEIVEAVEVEQKERGFTLVELLIVIVILGILATVTVFAVRGIATSSTITPTIGPRSRAMPPMPTGGSIRLKMLR